MSFALQVAYKAVIIGLIVAIAVGLMGALGSVIVNVFNDIDVSLDGNISGALRTGRELANNFINGYVLNACIGLWFTAFIFASGYTFVLYIHKLMDL